MMKNKNINYLLTSRIFSEFSGSMYPVVYPLYVLHISGSLALSGAFFTLIMLPWIILSPVAGVWIERKSKKKVIISATIFLALLYLFQAILIFTNGKPSLILLGVLASGISFASKLSDLTTKVMFSEIVPADELEKYNGVKSILDNIASFGAPVIGAAIYGWCGFAIFSIISGVIYSASLLLLVPIHYRQVQAGIKSKDFGFFGQLRDGLLFLRRNKEVLNLVILSASLNFFVASSGNITNPGILVKKYGISNQLFGFAEVAFSLGVLLSGLFIAKQSKISLQKNIAVFLIMNSGIMIAIGSLSVLMFSLPHSLYFSVFLLLQILLGFVTILVNVPIMSFYQSNVPVDFQGRFFALSSFLGSISISIGTSYAGIISQKMGADVAYIFSNLCVIVIVLAVMYRKKPSSSELK